VQKHKTGRRTPPVDSGGKSAEVRGARGDMWASDAINFGTQIFLTGGDRGELETPKFNIGLVSFVLKAN
jgi:hypothetical protein